MSRLFSFVLLATTLLLAACTFQIAQPNPAAVHCTKEGGSLHLVDSANGTFGICTFADGSVCDEWTFFDGTCQPGEHLPSKADEAATTPAIGMPNPASVACGEQGGTSVIVQARDGSEYGVCRFADESVCDEWRLFDGACAAGENLPIREEAATGQSGTGVANPASTHCLEQKGGLVIVQARDDSEYGLCVFDDGSICDEWRFLDGACTPGQQFPQPAAQEASAGLANPAAVHCVEQGGGSLVLQARDGSEYGLCQLPSGKFCEEFAFLNGECKP